MLSNAAWGERIYTYGTKNFYSNSIWIYSWPTQPPLINSIYGFNKKMHIEFLGRLAGVEFQLNKLLPGEKVPWLSNFVDWYGYGRVDLENPFQIGFLVTMKFIPIVSDLGIAWLIYEITKKAKFAIIYLISPFSWYVSSLWGQYDPTGAFFALAAFWALDKKWKLLSPALLMISILIKPTSLILIPFYFYLLWKSLKGNFLKLAASLILPIIIFWITTVPYTHKNPFEFARYDLTRILFEKSEPRVSVNSFNMWRIFTGDKPINSTSKLFFVSWETTGYILVLLVNSIAIWYCERKKKQANSFWMGLTLVSVGTWMVMTGMLERYLFLGMVAGLIASAVNPRLLKYWIGVSLIFWINLFYHWWIPEGFQILKELLLWQNGIITNALSLLMLILIGKMIYVQSRTS
jgi:hypothetical protein